MRARRNRLKRIRRQRAQELNPARQLGLVQIPPSDIDDIWPLVEEYIIAGCDYGEVPADEFKAKCKTEDAQLWVAWSDHCEGAAITQLLITPHGKACLLACMSCDDYPRCHAELAPQWEAWARGQGCAIMRLGGRFGWERMLKDYTRKWVVLDKRL